MVFRKIFEDIPHQEVAYTITVNMGNTSWPILHEIPRTCVQLNYRQIKAMCLGSYISRASDSGPTGPRFDPNIVLWRVQQFFHSVTNLA